MSTTAELRDEACALRALARIRAKLADGAWRPNYRFTNAENRLLESIIAPWRLGLEKRPLFPGAKHGDWRLTSCTCTPGTVGESGHAMYCPTKTRSA